MKSASLRYTFLGLGLVLWLYWLLRAIYVPLVHDEAATFFFFINNTHFIPFVHETDANNHVLNSILSWICHKSFGTSALTLRIPNLLAGLMMMVYSYRIAKWLRHEWLKVVFLLALWGAQYFTEFFSMTRGYGLSMGLLTAAFYYFFLTVKEQRTRDFVLAGVFGSLALLANLTLTAPIGMVFGALLLTPFLEANTVKTKLTRIGAWLLVAGGPLIFLAAYSLYLKDQGYLYYGSSAGFWEVTMWSLSRMFLGTGMALFRWFIVIFLIFIGIAFWPGLKLKLKSFYEPGRFFALLLLGNVLAVLFISNVLGVNFPEDRAALFFFPFLVGAAVFLADSLERLTWLRYCLAIPLLYLPVRQAIQVNLTHSLFWPQERLPESWYDLLLAEQGDADYPPTLGGKITHEMTWTWYQFLREGKLGRVQHSSHPVMETDYLICDPSFYPTWDEFYDTLAYDEPSGNALLKRRNPLPKTLLDERRYVRNAVPDTFEYYDLYRDSIASQWVGKTLYIEVDLRLTGETKPFKSRLMATIDGLDHPNARYEYFPLDWLQPEWNGTAHNIHHTFVIPNLPEGSQRLLVYLWNQNSVKMQVDDAFVKVYELTRDYEPEWQAVQKRLREAELKRLHPSK